MVDKKKIEINFDDEEPSDSSIIIRPLYLSICAADQRYFNFERNLNIIKKKLPMALIHEAVGLVLFDPKEEFKYGEKVILIPNIPSENDPIISENYLRSSVFRSSGYDGFMQEILIQPRDRILRYNKKFNDFTMAFAELMSVAIHAIERFDEKSHKKREILGVWGDGSLAYIIALFLKHKYNNSKVIVFGKHKSKLDYFTFINDKYIINEDLSKLYVDHAFECVGGNGSVYAINQIIDIINPEGTVALLGVNEDYSPINTRMCLEKGLTIIGNSRSRKKDFEILLENLKSTNVLNGYLKNLISSIETVRSIKDIIEVFELDKNKYWGKTVIQWEI